MSNPSPLYGKIKGNSCFVHQVVYEETYYARDSGTLEQLKELSTKRQAIEESINGSSKITPAIAREMAGGVTSPVLQVFFLLLLGVIEYFLWVHVWYTVRGQCAKQRGYQTNTDVQKDMQEISSYFSGSRESSLRGCICVARVIKNSMRIWQQGVVVCMFCRTSRSWNVTYHYWRIW
jgi:hypothetical protein